MACPLWTRALACSGVIRRSGLVELNNEFAAWLLQHVLDV